VYFSQNSRMIALLFRKSSIVLNIFI
jgi:hypothetical protein